MSEVSGISNVKVSIALLLSLAVVGQSLSAQNPDSASKVYAQASKSVLLLLVRSEQGEIVGQGTGFVMAGGKIVTNEHVVRKGNILIDLGTARLPATIERVDAFNDLAVLTAGAELAAKPLSLSDAVPAPGSGIYAIGNPAGLEKTISTGVVSGVRELSGRSVLQITAPISPGSSGGPILNSSGEVVGVAVGILEKGQNLNFAVPAAKVRALIAGNVEGGKDVPELLKEVESLAQRRSQLEYAADPDSDWQKLDRQIDAALKKALENAGSDATVLLKIAKLAEIQNTEIAIESAQRAVRAQPTAEGHFILGKELNLAAAFSEDAEKRSLLERAEKAMRDAFRISKQPTAEMYYYLGYVLEQRASYVEAEANFQRTLQLSKTASDVDWQATSLRGLLRTAHVQGKHGESDGWFKALIETGKASAWDWQGRGSRLDELQRFGEAGKSYRQAALLGAVWTNWCEAAGSFRLAGGEEDAVLSCARKCLAEGSGKKDSERSLADAHYQIAKVLNGSGVYQEALGHAREAASLAPNSAWAFNEQAEALLGLRRFHEAINASNQAIRLSDGKYSFMHFNLGSAYFDLENWEFAKQSFEKAAQLSQKDSAAAYNVALCFARLRFYRDAANWYEEVLRREPNHAERQDILSKIQRLRR